MPPRLADLDLLLFDFDGVMTDNRVYVFSDGAEAVSCNRADGWGFDLLRSNGLEFAIVSTEENPVVAARGRKLHVPVYQGVGNKRETVLKIVAKTATPLERVAFVGNDTNDLPAFDLVGWPMCPSDAHPEVRAAARFALKTVGGAGVVRELADVLLGVEAASSEPGGKAQRGKKAAHETTTPRSSINVSEALAAARALFAESVQVKQSILEGEQIAVLVEMAHRIACSIQGGGKLLLCGNGGSAADAQHLAAELLVRLLPHVNRDAIPAIALAADASSVTACGNDFGFELVFERMVRALATPRDVVLGLSTSGRSMNVIRALNAAREIDAVAFGFLGGDGGSALESCDLAFVVPSDDTGRIQESHITAGHCLMGLVEDELICHGHIGLMPGSA